MKVYFKIFILNLLFFPIYSGEFIPPTNDHIRINSQVQLALAKIFTEDYFDAAEGFYDPRLGVVLILEYKGRIDCAEFSEEISPEEQETLSKECLREKIRRLQFAFQMKKLLKEQERLFFGIFAKDGNRLEIWKKDLLDGLDDSKKGKQIADYIEPTSFLYLNNGSHPKLGIYPNWFMLEKIRIEILSKLKKMKYESAFGLFIPGKGFIFVIKAKRIPVKKMIKFNKKLITELKKVENSGQFLIQYFYGGDRGELSNFIRISDGFQSYLQYGTDIY